MRNRKGQGTLPVRRETLEWRNLPRAVENQTGKDAGSRGHARFVTGLDKSRKEDVDARRASGSLARTLTIRVLSFSFLCVANSTQWNLTYVLYMLA